MCEARARTFVDFLQYFKNQRNYCDHKKEYNKWLLITMRKILCDALSNCNEMTSGEIYVGLSSTCCCEYVDCNYLGQ